MSRFLLLGLALLLSLRLPATAAVPPIVLSELVGESLLYDISFLWFDRIAEGRFSFTAGDRPGLYQAELEAKTIGVAGWLTGERTQRYRSIMEEKNGRLRPLYHEASILTGKGSRQIQRGKSYLFDYQNAEVRYERSKNGAVTKREFLPFDRTTPPQDVLTAFIAFRTGQVGDLLPGQRYLIPTYSHKGLAEIVVETIDDSERNKYSFPAQGLLAKVRIDPEVFDTSDGEVYLWFDAKGQPAGGIVENVIGLGNVRGILRGGDGF